MKLGFVKKKYGVDEEAIRFFERREKRPIFLTGFFSVISALVSSPETTTVVVGDRLQRKAARVFGKDVILFDDLIQNISEFKLLSEAFKMLNDRKVAIYSFNRPATSKNMSSYDSLAIERMSLGLNFPTMLDNITKYEKHFKQLFGNSYSIDYIEDLSRVPQVIKKGYYYGHEDFKSKFINTIGGKRVVTNSPDNPSKTIHFYGRCGAFGYAVEDRDTIPSLLQDSFNATNEFGRIKVSNHGLWGGGDEYIISNFLRDSHTFKENDIVVFYMRHFSKNELSVYQELGLHYYDITKEYHMYPCSKWAFYDRVGHASKDGYRFISKIIFDKLLCTKLAVKQVSEERKNEVILGCIREYLNKDQEDAFLNELEAYLTNIKEKYCVEANNKVLGSIVMNCNPFTKGHRYLIEYAASKVDRLFIFILEEDKSFFKFSDRFELVRLGVCDLKNVIVIPSREFMISAMTFPEYFMKDYIQKKEIDATRDLQIFCEHICPALNITKRFAGEEPLDMVTKQYNDNMKKILPEWGIEFIEIPRLKVNSENVVSASKVRDFLKEKNFEEIRKYVPDTTYTFLLDHYKEWEEIK